MRREVFVLAVETAAAYLFYYVLVSGGDFFAGLAAAVFAVRVIAGWSLAFYKLGRKP
jgi:hypothetical protein